jgi:hypothetical protein
MREFQNKPRLRSFGRLAAVAASLAAGFGALHLAVKPQSLNAATASDPATGEAPTTLFETGLYVDPTTLTIDPEHILYAPNYPLWTDGAEKRRWISLPPGTVIDATDADAWDFPVGTRFWKEFSFAGHRVETRYMERLTDGSWLFATYGWSADGRSAVKVSGRGKRSAYALDGGRAHTIPGLGDCSACHLSGPTPVLGFGAVQLAIADPAIGDGAGAQAGDSPLASLIARGRITGLDEGTIPAPAETGLDGAALGYLHGNCSHCHNAQGPLARLGLDLRLSATGSATAARATSVGVPLISPPPGLAPGTVHRIEPGRPGLSALAQRIASRNPSLQMPPLGTELVDAEAVEEINRWIAEMEVVSTTHRHHEGNKP